MQTSSPVQEIKDRLDIIEVIKQYVTLQPAGKNFKGLCPFHREKTPSFMVSPERQSWHCFGCNTGGDMFTFVMRYENAEFGEALRMLAERAGVELKRVSPQEYKQFGLLYEINSAAKDFFVRNLSGEARVKTYLTGRGLHDETIGEFEVGWSHPAPDALIMALMKAGYDQNDIIRAGLALRTDRGLVIDRFRGRIMFPIHNHGGKVIGFTGRILPEFERDDVGKYVNSPETPIFLKSKILYGFFASKPFVREKGSAFLVEGQMDFLMSWQAGIKNAVATSGTALTGDHLLALRKLCDVLVFRFDTDEAGQAALERAIDLAEAQDFGVRVAFDETHKDPAEAVLKDPAGFSKTIENAIPAPEFYFRRYLPQREGLGYGDFRDREYLRRLRTVLGKLNGIASPVERTTWIKELSKRTGVSESALLEEMGRMAPQGSGAVASREPETLSAHGRTRLEFLSEQVLASAAVGEDMELIRSCEKFFHPRYREAALALLSGKRTSEHLETDALLHSITLANAAASPEEIAVLRAHLEREYGAEKRKELAEKIRQAEAAGDQDALDAALRELAELPKV